MPTHYKGKKGAVRKRALKEHKAIVKKRKSKQNEKAIFNNTTTNEQGLFMKKMLK